ncbi:MULTISPECIES: hypothetical protein [Streptomyces]
MAKSTKIQVDVKATVEVDVSEWAGEFGLDDFPSIVRADVQRYVESLVRDMLNSGGTPGLDLMKLV